MPNKSTSINFGKLLEIALLLVATTLFFYLRIIDINRPFWKDELTTLETLHASVTANPLFYGVSTNLPFFYYAMRVFNFFGGLPVFAYRLLPLAFNLATLIYLYIFVRKYFGRFAACVFAFLFSCAPIQVYYSLELRAYSLTQLLLAVQATWLYLFFVEPDARKYKKSLLIVTLFTLLLLLTHYAGYIFVGAEFLFILLILALGKIDDYKKVRQLVYVFAGLLLVGVAIILAMSRGPHFAASVGSMDMGHLELKKLLSFFSLSSLVRIKEVLTFYYWYGLYYFYADPWVQFLVKKMFSLLLLVGVYVWVKDKNATRKQMILSVVVILLLTLAGALFGEKLGLYPFGGRHIMPFAFFLYIVVAYIFERLYRWTKFSVLFLLLFIILFSLFDYCGVLRVPKPLGTWEVQGQVYRQCIGI